MKHNVRTLSGMVVVAIALSVIATSGFALAQGAGSSPLDGADEDNSVTQNAVNLSAQEAIDIATAEANGTVQEVELESEDGIPVYKVKLVAASGSETEITVHANDGTVLKTESEEDGEIEENETEEENESIAPDTVNLSEQEAIDIATAEANGTVQELELESEDGIPVYKVKLVAASGSETEITVHANDGTVLETESEEDDEVEEDDGMEEDDEVEEDDGIEEDDEVEEDDGIEEDDEVEEDDEMEEDEIEEDDESVASDTVSLSEQEAIDTATAEASGTVAEVELESEDGTPVYEIELAASGGAETEVTVHANDGTVLNTETEDE